MHARTHAHTHTHTHAHTHTHTRTFCKQNFIRIYSMYVPLDEELCTSSSEYHFSASTVVKLTVINEY